MSSGSGVTSGGSPVVTLSGSGGVPSALRPLTEEELLAKDTITPDDVLRLNRFTRGILHWSMKCRSKLLNDFLLEANFLSLH